MACVLTKTSRILSVGIPRLTLRNLGWTSNTTSTTSTSILSVDSIFGCRTLFTAKALGLDGYEKQRVRVETQFSGMLDKFKSKMEELTVADDKSMIFTEDLKNMCHIIDNEPKELTLIHQMMRRFNQQNKHLRFGNYVFGPVIMRMYHYLNEPKAALEVFKDEKLDGFFDQLASFQILLDLMYRNEMYNEILETFEIIKTKQLQGTKYPRNVIILVFGACYKMNTVESYEYVLKILSEMKDAGVSPVRKAIGFAAALALNQSAPQIALEILAQSTHQNYVTIRNLKILSMSEIGRPEDALPIIRFSLEQDMPDSNKKSSVCGDVIANVSKALDASSDKELKAEFERIQKALHETGKISNQTIQELLNADIEAIQTPMKQRFDRKSMERSFRINRGMNIRPQRNLMYERDRTVESG